MRRSNSSWREECEATLADLVPCSLEETFSGETKKPRRAEKPRLPLPHSACASARRGARRRRTCGGKVATPSTASDGEEAVFAWQGEVQVRAVHSVSSRQAERQLRELHPLPAWQGEALLRELQPLPAWQGEALLRELQPVPAWQGEIQLRGLQPVSAREVQIQVPGLQSRSRGSAGSTSEAQTRPRDQAQA